MKISRYGRYIRIQYKRRVRKSKRNNTYKTQRNIFICLCIILLLLLAKVAYNGYLMVDFNDYYGKEEPLYINPAVSPFASQKGIKYENGEVYLPFELVKEDIDPNIYRSVNKDRIIITTGSSVIRMRSDNNSAYINDEPMELNMPIYDTEYIAGSVLEKIYKVNLTYYEKNNSLVLYYTDRDRYGTTLKAGDYLRYNPEWSSKRSVRLKKGSEVVLISTLKENTGDYTLVTTSEGLCGYVKTSALGNINPLEPEISIPEAKTPWKCEEGRANIVFDQVTNSSANKNYDRIPIKDGVDVICPTWFSFENINGDIVNLADKAYVDSAHARGIKVWGLLTDNFDKTISHNVLSNEDARENAIKQLLAYSALYELDGINIDFEAVPSEDGELFVQFLRELAPMLHEEGLTLTADFFVPKPWTHHYNRGACARVLDYVIVMGYDQHYAGSRVAGSNAEIGWSEEAITATLAQGVPKEKLILGIPFYTRVWTIENATGKVSQKAMSMKAAKDFMTEKGALTKWLEGAGQNYGEISQADYTYKCWFEDGDSLRGRLKLVKDYDIAGTAAWKSGMETSDIWDILKEGLKGEG